MYTHNAILVFHIYSFGVYGILEEINDLSSDLEINPKNKVLF